MTSPSPYRHPPGPRLLARRSVGACSVRSIDAVQTHSIPPRPSFRRPSSCPDRLLRFPTFPSAIFDSRVAVPGLFPHIIPRATSLSQNAAESDTTLLPNTPLVSPILPIQHIASHASQHVTGLPRRRAATSTSHINTNQQLISSGTEGARDMSYSVAPMRRAHCQTLLMKLGFRNTGVPRALE